MGIIVTGPSNPESRSGQLAALNEPRERYAATLAS